MPHIGIASQLASDSFCDTRPVDSVVEGEVSELIPSVPKLQCQICLEAPWIHPDKNAELQRSLTAKAQANVKPAC